MSLLLQRFAWHEDAGRYVSVDEVPRGLACRCICKKCEDKLIARQGRKRSWHFAHRDLSQCVGEAESALHRAAKQIIIESRGMLLPAFDLVTCAANNLPADIQLDGWVDFDDVLWEQSKGNRRADLIGVSNHQKYIIEIEVTNPVSSEKQRDLERLGLPAIAIDLSQQHKVIWNLADLREVVLNQQPERRWICLPKYPLADLWESLSAGTQHPGACYAFNRLHVAMPEIHQPIRCASS